MPRWRCDPSRLTSRAVQLILLVCWVALVVWKVLTFKSEPTTSETYFEDDFHRPYITVCPFSNLNNRADQYLETAQHSENHTTLLDVFKYGGYSVLDMLTSAKDLNPYKDDPNRGNYFAGIFGNWTDKINYALGGFCASFEASKPNVIFDLKRDIPKSAKSVHRRFFTHKRFVNTRLYDLHVHKLDDFWGGLDDHFTILSDSEMLTYEIPQTMKHQELVINIERDVRPNMRRKPCEEDPSYSRSTCWRDCFLDSLKCSLLEGDNTSGKPTCTAADYSRFIDAYPSYIFFPGDRIVNGKLAFRCSCRPPCVLERYTISARPSLFDLAISMSPVVRTTKTYITYDIIDLLADIGGFVGLLLGYSLYSVFDDVKTLVTRLFKRRAASTHVDPVLAFSIKIDPEQREGKQRNIKKNGWRSC